MHQASTQASSHRELPFVILAGAAREVQQHRPAAEPLFLSASRQLPAAESLGLAHRAAMAERSSATPDGSSYPRREISTRFVLIPRSRMRSTLGSLPSGNAPLGMAS